MPPDKPLLEEGERVLRLCNACRYCEGFCAVFPAMERRTTFNAADLNYLANLCHNCSECYYACPYTPPHEYALNLPQLLTQIRVESYAQYASPQALFRASRDNGWLLAGVIAAAIAAMASLAAITGGFGARAGDFFSVIPHGAMVAALGLVFVLSLLAMTLGVRRFWKDGLPAPVALTPLLHAVRDALRLENLRGCPYPGDQSSAARVWFHHATFYGFFLCFASTCVAAFYDLILSWEPPYGFLSLPVILGTVGGIGLLIGPAGLFALKLKRDPELDDLKPRGFGEAFIILLFLTSFSGLLLLLLRSSAAMGWLLIVHLGIVAALFALFPYGKFVHGIYRFAALLRNAIEKTRG